MIPSASPNSPLLARHFFVATAVILASKLILSWWLPLTGDEAYFVVWGMFPDYGYYDHPPLVGWWLALAQLLSAHPTVLRLLGIVASSTPALLVYLIYRRMDETKARLLSLMLLSFPLYFIGILVTTDSGLILFGLLSITACWRGLQTQRAGWFLLSGVLLGLAFLSKYFAVLIGIGLAAHLLLFERRNRWALPVIILGTLPFIALNIYWNSQNCWYNVMFNVVNRHSGDRGDYFNIPVYLITLIYLFTPWLMWSMWRQRKNIIDGVRKHRLGLFISTSIIPLALFFVVSPSARIGLHWLAVFIPGLVLVSFFLSTQRLHRCTLYMVCFGAAHVLLLFTLLATPIDLFKDQRRYADVVFHLKPHALSALTATYDESWWFFTSSYSRSAIMTYYSDRYFGVFGAGSHYGRQDDLLTDFRDMHGENMIFLPRRGTAELDPLLPFFASLTVRPVEIHGAVFEVIEAKGFDYPAYRETILERVRDRYYQFPNWLPMGQCRFTERYF